MKKLIVFLLSQIIFLCLRSQNPNPNPALSNFIINEMSNEHIPGASTLIVKNGQIVWLESFGMADIANNKPVTENTIFLLASISKLFTGTALMNLEDDGLIDLDDPINDFAPFSIDIPNHTNADITFRMLMTHTASIEDNNSVLDTYYSVGDPTLSLSTIMQQYFCVNGSDYSATGNFHNKQPGTFYDYSNIGTALAGYMVEVVSGIPFDQYCETHIFNPLSMNNTSWFLAGLNINDVAVPYAWQGGNFVPYQHYGFADYPNGLLRLDILDLANYMIAFLQNGTFNGNTILSNSAVSEMLTLQVPSLDPTQGLNWYQEEIFLNSGGSVSLWGHNGGEDGVSTDIYINPANGIGVAILTNGEGDNLLMIDELYNYALTLTAPLAVELKDFSVEARHQKTQLTWQTASETDNQGFEIEYSINGNNWQKIGFVKGKGNSKNLNNYQFFHQFPTLGMNYYRLKQIDFSGKFEYSFIQSIEFLNADNQWFVCPNPIGNGECFISIDDSNFESGQVSIFDSTGRKVYTQRINEMQFEIQINHLPKGIYSMRLEYNGQQFLERIVVQ